MVLATESGRGIALDSNGKLYLAGSTTSTSFPTSSLLSAEVVQSSRSGAVDAFVAVLTSGGDELLYRSLLGGSGRDWANGIALVADGRFAITGSTDSTNFPTSATPYRDTLAGGTDAFVSLFDIASRTVTYSYDGLQRLTGAVASTGTNYAYTYDKVGNRTSITVGTATSHLTYTVTDQVVGWSYDAAGNLKNDGTTQSDYDALGRLTQTITAGQTRTNSYNGDNVLIAQLANGTTTRYTQDLVSPLSQMLQSKVGSATTNYLYGLERLASVSGSTTTWYGTDALGSVRLTMSNAGLPVQSYRYDPWGTPQAAAPPTFGFTGELQDAGTGLVNLRARWYQPTSGRFTSRDPWGGDPTRSSSLHKYSYVENDPVNAIDPTGYKRLRIWAAAFIMPSELIFPHIYANEVAAAPPATGDFPGIATLVDPNARWHGDGRDFTKGYNHGSTNPEARQWNEVIIDTERSDPLVSNKSGTGATAVIYFDSRDNRYHSDVGHVPPPALAKVTTIGCTIEIRIHSATHNPLVRPEFFSPKIIYDYTIVYSMDFNSMSIKGAHTWFPWHELYVSDSAVGLVESFDPRIDSPRFVPRDPTSLMPGPRHTIPQRTWSLADD